MSELAIPAALRHARSSFRYLDNTGVSRSPFGGGTQTTGYGGDRIGATIDFTPHGGRTSVGVRERAILKALQMRQQGKQNRIFVEDNSTERAGSFPAPEVFSYADLSNAASWTASASLTATAVDGVLRCKATAAGVVSVSQSVTVTPYAAYALRSIFRDGTLSGISAGVQLNSVDTYSTTRGYHLTTSVPGTTPLTVYPLVISSASGFVPPGYIDLAFTSLARCIQVDGGSNLQTFSDQFDNAAYTPTGCTVGANAVAAPDGTTTADDIIETAVTSGHDVMHSSITVASAAADYSFTCYMLQGGRGWGYVQMTEMTGTTSVNVFVNIAAGTLGTINTGANWSNARAYISNVGGSWRKVTLVARKTNAATAIRTYVGAATADVTASYLGVAASHAISIWRATLAQSSLPTRGRQTTTVAVAADTTSGNTLEVKGLPTSTNGLLLEGDWIEIDGQIKTVVGSLDSDGTGNGVLQFSPPLRRAVSDNTPIIVHRPMGRFMLTGEAGWDNTPGVFSSAAIELEEVWA